MFVYIWSSYIATIKGSYNVVKLNYSENNLLCKIYVVYFIFLLVFIFSEKRLGIIQAHLLYGGWLECNEYLFITHKWKEKWSNEANIA